MDLPGQQFLAGAGFAPDQHGQGLRCQTLKVFTQLLRTRVDEHQGLGTDAQRAFVQLREGQQWLAKRVLKRHDELPPQACNGRASGKR